MNELTDLRIDFEVRELANNTRYELMWDIEHGRNAED